MATTSVGATGEIATEKSLTIVVASETVRNTYGLSQFLALHPSVEVHFSAPDNSVSLCQHSSPCIFIADSLSFASIDLTELLSFSQIFKVLIILDESADP